MDDFDKHEVLLAFVHRGRQVQPQPWAGRRCFSNPTGTAIGCARRCSSTNRRRSTRATSPSTAIECGIVSFEAVFMPYMLSQEGQTADRAPGRTVARAQADEGGGAAIALMLALCYRARVGRGPPTSKREILG
jgi:hypothetical protein